MKRATHSGSQRTTLVPLALSVFFLVFAMSLVAGGQTVRDQFIAQIIDAPEKMFVAMYDFVRTAEALLEVDRDAYDQMLADPDAWFGAEYGITLKNAGVWTLDLTVESPPDGGPWLYESPYVGERELMSQGIFFSGPELALFIQVAEDEAASDDPSPSDPTQAFLEIISGRSEEALSALRTSTLRVNLPGESDEETFFKERTREALYVEGLTLPAGSTRLLVIDLPLGMEYGAVHFGAVSEGQVRAPQGFVILGEHMAVAYNATI